MITNLLFCISSQDVTCLHVLQAPQINTLCRRGTHSAATTSRLCRLMRTCIAATRKVSHVFIYKYVYKVSGAHAPLGPTVDTPLDQRKQRAYMSHVAQLPLSENALMINGGCIYIKNIHPPSRVYIKIYTLYFSLVHYLHYKKVLFTVV